MWQILLFIFYPILKDKKLWSCGKSEYSRPRGLGLEIPVKMWKYNQTCYVNPQMSIGLRIYHSQEWNELGSSVDQDQSSTKNLILNVSMETPNVLLKNCFQLECWIITDFWTGKRIFIKTNMKPTWMLRLSTVADKDVHLSSKLEIPRTKFSHFDRTVFKNKRN